MSFWLSYEAHDLMFRCSQQQCNGGAENARLENAELENAAPNCRTGKRETFIYCTSVTL